MSMKGIKIHKTLADGIRMLGLSAQETADAMQISVYQAKRVLAGETIILTQDQVDIIKSVLKNQLSYALSARIERLLNSDKTRQPFVAWVHSAAQMLDVYETLQTYQNQCNFINCMDPFLTGLYTVDVGMRETRNLLIQIHKKCPQFDQLFFYGTRFLETLQGIPSDVPRCRVPTSIDVFALSPEDAKIREKLVKETT